MRSTISCIAILSMLSGLAVAQTPAPDPLFASGDFIAAERSDEAALQKSPVDAVSLAALARIRLYEEHRGDARDLAGKALKADPDNIVAKKVLAGAAARDAAFAPDVYRISMPRGGTSVSFVATDPLPALRVRVNKSRDAYFLLDTGAPDIVLDKDFAAELGVKVAVAGQGTFAGGKHAEIFTASVPTLQVGDATIENVPASVFPTRGFQLKPGIRIDGILGTGFLMHFLATIDYAKGKLILRPRTDSADFEKSAKTAVTMWLVGDHFIFARGRLGNAPEALFNIDTGLAGGGLQATRSALEAAGIPIDESKARTESGPGGPVRIIPFKADAALGAFAAKDIDGIYTPDGDQFGLFPFRVAGTLSHTFFRKSALTFDFVAMKLVLE